LKSENDFLDRNIILVDPNQPDEIVITAFETGFPQITIPNNLATATFHELGHVIYAGSKQTNVIDFENKVRGILKVNIANKYFNNSLKKRPYDLTHNPTSSGTTVRN